MAIDGLNWFVGKLYDMIKDDSDLPTRKIIRCNYTDCITILNQENAKDQLFCSIHQGKVQEILDRQIEHPDYKRYYKLVKNSKNKHKKKYRRVRVNTRFKHSEDKRKDIYEKPNVQDRSPKEE